MSRRIERGLRIPECRELTWKFLFEPGGPVLELKGPRWATKPVRIEAALVEHVLTWAWDIFDGAAANSEADGVIKYADLDRRLGRYRLNARSTRHGIQLALSADDDAEIASIAIDNFADFLRAMLAAAVILRGTDESAPKPLN